MGRSRIAQTICSARYRLAQGLQGGLADGL
jgi:hypothetical protein